MATAVAMVGCLSARLTPAAALTIGNYEKWRASNQVVQATPKTLLASRLFGVFRGLETANALLKKRGQAPLFCRPPGVKMTGGAIAKMVDQELRGRGLRGEKPYQATRRISDIVAIAVARRWPCGR